MRRAWEMVILTCACEVYTHTRIHVCAHTIMGEKPVSRQKRRLVKENFVAICQQLWTRGWFLPLCLRNPPCSPKDLLGTPGGPSVGQIFLAGGGGLTAEPEGWVPESPTHPVWDGPERGNLEQALQRCQHALGQRSPH